MLVIAEFVVWFILFIYWFHLYFLSLLVFNPIKTSENCVYEKVIKEPKKCNHLFKVPLQLSNEVPYKMVEAHAIVELCNVLSRAQATTQ